MARPLPKDREDQVRDTAFRSEVRSTAFMAFIVGMAVGFGLGAAVFADTGGSVFFFIGAFAVGLMWFLAARARRTSKID